MASAEFDETIEEKRPTVQVGDPFTEKRLMEACLELMQTGAVISIQDMGAAGLTCSAVEMGDKGELGIRLDLEKVPTREPNMTAYEMMLSESQERMLMVLRPEKEAEAKAVFDKWDLDFAIVGETIPEDRFLIMLNGDVRRICHCALCRATHQNTTAHGLKHLRRRTWMMSQKLTQLMR